MNLDALEPLPEAEKLEPKDEFRERYEKLLGDEYLSFLRHSLSYINKSVRVNLLKAGRESVRNLLEGQGFEARQVPWCREGFWLSGERSDLGNLREHFLGYVYVQEAASMIPPVVLGPEPGDSVLDMCASPGSKTTQMASMMENKGMIIANDVTGLRMKPLGLNLQRNGVSNAAVTMMRGQSFSLREGEFDRVLVDAPCSGTGTIRRSPDTLKVWNPKMIRRLSKTQKSLAEAGFKALKTGGVMVYSTCSVEPEENEEVADFVLGRFPEAEIQEIGLSMKRSDPFLEFEGKSYCEKVRKCLRIWPQDNNTEGFFVAKIKKS